MRLPRGPRIHDTLLILDTGSVGTMLKSFEALTFTLGPDGLNPATYGTGEELDSVAQLARRIEPKSCEVFPNRGRPPKDLPG
jgi:hypothetical protein